MGKIKHHLRKRRSELGHLSSILLESSEMRSAVRKLGVKNLGKIFFVPLVL
jgi:hypothetical protein